MPRTNSNTINYSFSSLKQDDNGYYSLLFQQGDEKAFTWFFKQLYPPLSLYAFKITKDREVSEELASAAFTKIWQRHDRFIDAFSVKAYLYRIVRNDAFKYLRKQKQLASVTEEVVYLYGSEQERDAFNSLVTTETSRLLLTAINSLPKECTKVFRLLYIEGKSIKETAEALHLSPSTVKTQKARGLEALRKSLRFSLVVTMAVMASFFMACLS